MQAQFGKEVLGSVRLEEARKHKDKAETIRRAITSDTDIETKRLLKAQAKDESRLYSKKKMPDGLCWLDILRSYYTLTLSLCTFSNSLC